MASTELSWEKATPAPFVLLYGPFQLTAHRALTRIRARLRQDYPELEITTADAQTYRSGELLDWASPSLFGEPKLIIIENVHMGNDAFFADANEVIAAPANPDVTFVFRHEKGNKGKGFIDSLKKLDEAVTIANPVPKKGQEKQRLLLQLFAAGSRRPGPGVAELLLEAFAESLEELDAAVSQLLRDVDGDITRDDVQQYFGGRIETNAFQVADATLRGQIAQAVLLLRQALASGVPGILIVGTIGNKLRLMAKVSAADSGEPGSRKLSGAPWQIKNAKNDLAGWNANSLGIAVTKLAETDAALKGDTKTPDYALERLVIDIAQLRRR